MLLILSAASDSKRNCEIILLKNFATILHYSSDICEVLYIAHNHNAIYKDCVSRQVASLPRVNAGLNMNTSRYFKLGYQTFLRKIWAAADMVGLSL